MKRKRKILFIFVIVALLSLSMKDAEQKSLHFAVPVNYDINYDPVEGNYINLQFFFRSVYATLFKLDENLRPYPFLLETFKRKGKTVIFHLKKEAKFSDGSDITSGDVVRSIEAGMIHSSYPNPVYKVIRGGEELFKGKTRHCTGIKILDPKRFEILLKNENVEFDHYFAAVIMSILPGDRNRNQDKMLFPGPFQGNGISSPAPFSPAVFLSFVLVIVILDLES
jgi:ABC-type transport system substrate-binding protein